MVSELHIVATDRYGFRARGAEISRLEAFTDVVFGFALTLVGISLEVPHSYAELVARLRGFPAFAICFGLLVQIWYEHYRFFRRYDLGDAATVALNSVLLGLLLTYVYPLKFLFSLFSEQLLPTGNINPQLSAAQAVQLMVLFGVGFAALWMVFGLMYGRAWQKRVTLGLSPREEFETRRLGWRSALMAGVGGLAVVAALLLPISMVGRSALVYFLVAPLVRVFEMRTGQLRRL